MDFCPDCGTRLHHLPSPQTMFCRKCHQEIPLSPRIAKTSLTDTASHLQDSVIAITPHEAQLIVVPTTRIECPICSHDRAHYRTLEIWNDDGDTLDIHIYRCAQCKHTWREKA